MHPNSLKAHKHNQFKGHVAMALINLNIMLDSNTLTKDARLEAYAAYKHLKQLSEELKIRQDDV